MKQVYKPSNIIPKDAVAAFSSFYMQRTDELTRVKNMALVDYCEKNQFTREEYEAFKTGVATYVQFFMDCYAETTLVEH